MNNRNSVWFGVLAGILAPMAVYALLYLVVVLLIDVQSHFSGFDQSLLLLLSPIPNLFLIRYYFVSKKFDDTGRGLLLVTFIYVIAYFILISS
jgi:hypothetical protein